MKRIALRLRSPRRSLPRFRPSPQRRCTRAPSAPASRSRCRRSRRKAGRVKIVVADKSSVHNFHLTGPGVNVKTSVSAIGTKTFTVTLKKGTYKFVCDPHAFMKGSFTVR